MNKIPASKVIDWTIFAHKRRMAEGINGPWWELIHESERPLALEWVEQNKDVLRGFFG